MIDMNEKEKELNPEAQDNTENIPGANPDKTTENSPIPESVAGDGTEEPQGTDNSETEMQDTEQEEKGKDKEKDKEKEKSKRKLENEIKRLNGEIEKLNMALDEEKNRYIRLYAEYDNYRKRTASEKQAVYADAYADVLKEVLPVYDTLERALNMASDATDAANLVEGIKLTLDMFAAAFNRLGIERFGEPGEKFDPALHNAVMHEESEEHGEGEITAVFQPGFKKGDRVLRFAMVKVAN
jgi:molecular chaperone GrpE